MTPIADLVENVKQGQIQAIARAMSLVENEAPVARDIMDRLYTRTGRAYRIGITGPPGAGKSTLTAQLTRRFRQQGKTVGIVAVDPTSPFTGGAVLGDRIRMAEFATDPGVFIRSMASRGSMGGLARRTQEVADILDAAGKDVIIFETVGVGQTELDIAEAADTTIVVLVPESGDAIQAMKAGLMEIADIFVVNKADREGADRIKMELELMLQLRPDGEGKGWKPPIYLTVASRGEGVDALLTEIERHYQFLHKNGLLEARRRKRLIHKVQEMVTERLKEKFWTRDRRQKLEKRLPDLIENKISPYALADELVE
ncbi:MAG: methylmalonyl Co-A mutase-associated GTPase MeaB [Calditrichaeota bacterium]|nr:methylmalonyl Co-A mutase-associated GTPase MeaB [Calditrichota bacterium]